MTAYAARRLLQLGPTVLGAFTLVFLMVHFLPGDPAAFMAGDNLGEAALQSVRERLGLDRPLLVQFFDYLAGAIRFDWGDSLVTGLPVGELIARALPVTVLVGGLSLVLGFAIAIPLGTLAAYLSSRGKGALDQGVTWAAMAVDVMPAFWLAMLLMLLFTLALGWLPSTGVIDFGDPLALARRIALPVMVLTLSPVATIARITRTAVLDALGDDYVRTARAMGSSHISSVFRHALPNAALPIVTVAGLSFGRLLGGTVIIETVFALPGMGSLLVSGINGRDYPVVQGTILVYATLFILVNLATDLLYTRFDPRVKY